MFQVRVSPGCFTRIFLWERFDICYWAHQGYFSLQAQSDFIAPMGDNLFL